jgi:hypothetical protein
MLRSIYLLSFLLLQSLFAFAGNVKENVPSSFDLYASDNPTWRGVQH